MCRLCCRGGEEVIERNEADPDKKYEEGSCRISMVTNGAFQVFKTGARFLFDEGIGHLLIL